MALWKEKAEAIPYAKSPWMFEQQIGDWMLTWTEQARIVQDESAERVGQLLQVIRECATALGIVKRNGLRFKDCWVENRP